MRRSRRPKRALILWQVHSASGGRGNGNDREACGATQQREVERPIASECCPLPVRDFCRYHRHADAIPAVSAGRATVYFWRCTNGERAIVREVAQPDAQGFLANIRYEIRPASGQPDPYAY